MPTPADGRRRSLVVLVVMVMVVLLLAGCGSSSSQKTNPLGAVEKAVHQREAHERQTAPAVAHIERLGACADVLKAEGKMTRTVSAAVEPNSSKTTYAEASNDVEALRGKLASLAGTVTSRQRSQLEASRRFLLKVGTLVEAFRTHDLSLAQEELAGYRAGMVELAEHIKTACLEHRTGPPDER